jgi:hypothetical protein
MSWGDYPVKTVTSCSESNPATDPIDALARRLAAWGLTTPALLFLESVRPMGCVLGQCLHILSPALSMVTPARTLSALAATLEDREGIDRLLAAIERAGERRPPPAGEDSDQ